MRRVAFGVEFLVDDDEAALLPEGVTGAAASDPPTTVSRVTPGEIDARWAGARPQRTREMRDAQGRVGLSVDADERRGYLLETPADGRFLASVDGRELLCAPLPGAETTWHAILIGQLLPLLSTLRGLELFHASAVATGSGAVMLAAPVGLGKTSLALRMVLAGDRLIADDAVAVDVAGGSLRAHPGAGAFRVRAEEQARLTEEEQRRLGGASALGDRAGYRVPAAREPVPLTALFLLTRTREHTAPGGVRRTPVDPFSLLGSTFNLSVRTPERLQRQLDLCARIAAEVPVHTVEITPEDDAAATAERVREAMA